MKATNMEHGLMKQGSIRDAIERMVIPGKYVVAVSGGVDSMVLLHSIATIAQHNPSISLVVAHFDHGIRSDSAADRNLVEDAAKQLSIPFEYSEAHLGPGISEATARHARYNFLWSVKRLHQADYIVLAHHQDDVIETMCLNLLRGTGWRGLVSLKEKNGDLLRPFLSLPKSELIAYAEQQGLIWHEDSTNADTSIRRNYLRYRIAERMNEDQKLELISIWHSLQKIGNAIDLECARLLAQQPQPRSIQQQSFAMLPHSVACEIMAYWLLRSGIRSYSRSNIERLVIAAKTMLPRQKIDIIQHKMLTVTTEGMLQIV
jgi:tRNA(Ile)-lysidine synthase